MVDLIFMTTKTENKIWNEKLGQEALARDALKDVRSCAWQRFEESGFPSLKDESWRYTSTAFVASNSFQFAGLPKPDARTLDHLRARFESFKQSARLVFLDGWFVPQLSDLLPIAENVDFSNMRDLSANRPHALLIDSQKLTGFSALNAALFQDGVWLNVREGAQPKATLLIYSLQTSLEQNQTTQIRNMISLGAGAALKIVEWNDHLNGVASFINHETQIQLAPSALLEHLRLQQAGDGAWLRNASVVTLAEKSHYQRLDFEAGARVARNEINVHFSGEGSVCSLQGIGLGCGARHLDTQVMMNHSIPEASSSQVYRNLLSGQSRGVFGGSVRVHKDAQKTDASQVHKTLLLSDEARADTKPQLEIDADDVKCSHGAAIGQLDEDSLFYLRSRGISLKSAERMLAAGFVERVLDSISCNSLRDFFKEQLRAELAKLF